MTPAAAIAYVRHVAHNPKVPTFVRLCRARDAVRVLVDGRYEISCLDAAGHVTANIVGALPSPISGCEHSGVMESEVRQTKNLRMEVLCAGHGQAVLVAIFR